MKIKENEIVYIPVRVFTISDTQNEAIITYNCGRGELDIRANKDWLEQNAITKQETNLEHYKDDVIKVLMSLVTIKEFCDKHNIERINDYDSVDMYNWLLQPYQKPKYKLTKVEKDMLESINYYRFDEMGLIFVSNSNDFIVSMKAKGYFKDIPTDIPIADILEDCEVVYE